MSCSGVVDDDGFHEACEKLQEEDIPFFRQFSASKPPPPAAAAESVEHRESWMSSAADRSDSRESTTAHARDDGPPAQVIYFVIYLIIPFLTIVYGVL